MINASDEAKAENRGNFNYDLYGPSYSTALMTSHIFSLLYIFPQYFSFLAHHYKPNPNRLFTRHLSPIIFIYTAYSFVPQMKL